MFTLLSNTVSLASYPPTWPKGTINPGTPTPCSVVSIYQINMWGALTQPGRCLSRAQEYHDSCPGTLWVPTIRYLPGLWQDIWSTWQTTVYSPRQDRCHLHKGWEGCSQWPLKAGILPEAFLSGTQCKPLSLSFLASNVTRSSRTSKKPLWPLWLSVLATYPGPELVSVDAGHWLPSFNK